MGRPKASLPFGNVTMLEQVISRLDAARPTIDPIVVVTANNQSLPSLTRNVGELWFAHDQHPNQGPLEGLIAGLRRLVEHQPSNATSGKWTYVTSCDAPLLCPNWPNAMASHIRPGDQAVIPRDDARQHPLAAIYHLHVLEDLELLRTRGTFRLQAISDHIDAHTVPVEELRHIDPELQTLININTPEEYAALLHRCGLPSTDD